MVDVERASRRGVTSAIVAEDDEELAKVLAEELRGLGYVVRVVRDGAAALSALREEDPDLLLLDIGLPEHDGIAVAAASRRRGATFPILGMTGWRDPHIHEQARTAGCDLILKKPFTIEELQEAIECACAVATFMD